MSLLTIVVAVSTSLILMLLLSRCIFCMLHKEMKAVRQSRGHREGEN